MLYRLYVIDESEKPIAGAAITFKKGINGPAITTLTMGTAGYVAIDDGMDSELFEPGVIAEATAKGYAASSATTLNLSPESYFMLVKTGSSLVPLLLGAGLTLASLYALGLTGKQKRKTKSRKVSGPLSDISPKTKNILLLGGAGIVAYLVIFKGRTANTDLPDNAATELNQLAAQGIRPTISEAEAAGYAATIVSAADDCGTDESAIWNVFENLVNKADLLLLIKVYGIRQYKGCFDGDYFSWHNRNMGETITSELSNGWISDINTLLKEKGIDFKF